MQVIHCVCGERLEAGDDASLFAALRRHSDEAHAEMKLSDDILKAKLNDWSRSQPWDGKRRPIKGEIEIKPIEPRLAADYLRFFDRDAFADNPAWSTCYCYFYQFDGSPAAWQQRGGKENREARCAAIEAGQAHGLLAYAGGEPVGWCHAAPMATLPMLMNDDDVTSEHAERLGAIVCFLVAPSYRGQGVARKLLDRASDYLRDLGMTAIEAWPPKDAGSEARSYHGTLSMYRDAGFEAGAEDDGYVTVRKEL